MGFLDFWSDRQRTKEIERDMQVRRGKAYIRRYISNLQRVKAKHWEMGKRALALGDRQRFNSIGKQYLWTLGEINRWERSLLAYESIEVRRDQARSTREFMTSVQAMSKSMLAGISPKAMAETQKDLEMAISRVQDLEERLDFLVDATDETIFAFSERNEPEMERAFGDLERDMQREMGAEREKATAGEALDARIEEGLRRIEQEMRKDVNR